MSNAVEKLAAGPASPVARRRRWSEAHRLRNVAEGHRPRVSVWVASAAGRMEVALADGSQVNVA